MTTRRLTSTVWDGYTIDRPADGGAPTATCLECGLTLCAGSNNGTSHLRRHSKSKRCQQRAAELCAAAGSRSPKTTAAEPSPGDDDYDYYSPSPPVVVEGGEEKDCFTVHGMYIPELYDKLIAEGLDNIDQSEHFSAASNYVPVLPQAPSSSTRRFNDKRKQRQSEKAENKKRCAPDDDSGLHVSAQPDSTSEERGRESRLTRCWRGCDNPRLFSSRKQQTIETTNTHTPSNWCLYSVSAGAGGHQEGRNV